MAKKRMSAGLIHPGKRIFGWLRSTSVYEVDLTNDTDFSVTIHMPGEDIRIGSRTRFWLRDGCRHYALLKVVDRETIAAAMKEMPDG